MPSFAHSHIDTDVDEDDEDPEEADDRLALEEEIGMNGARGLEETLEKLGFGASTSPYLNHGR